MRFSDYFYATIPSFCLAGLVAQIMPSLEFLQGIEKLGIVGILAAGILFFVMERRSFLAKSGERLESVEKRLHLLETQVINGNDKVVHLLGEQLDALREIREGQAQNFSRMWDITLRSLNGTIKHGDELFGQLQNGQEHVLRPGEDQKQG